MARVIFIVMGCITLYSIPGMLIGVLFAARRPPDYVAPSTPGFFALLFFAALAQIVVGLGLIGLRKWAALMLSLPALYAGFWVLGDSLHYVPWSWDGIGYWWGLLLVSPSVFTVRYWRTLVWRAKRSETDGNSSAGGGASRA